MQRGASPWGKASPVQESASIQGQESRERGLPSKKKRALLIEIFDMEKYFPKEEENNGDMAIADNMSVNVPDEKNSLTKTISMPYCLTGVLYNNLSEIYLENTEKIKGYVIG